MKHFLFKIYLFKFLDDFVLIYPLYTVMFMDFGMAPWQIATLLTVWAITSMLLNIPTGALADKYSRKNLLFIGQIIRALGYAIWLIFPNFWGFLLGFICWGIKSALTSGTFEALIYDELKNAEESDKYTKIIGTSKSVSFLAIFCASILASPAILLGYPFVLILSCAAIILSGIFITTIPAAPKAKSTLEKDYFTLLKAGIREVMSNISLLQLILFLALAYALGGALDEYWTIFANGAGLAKVGLGLFLGAMSLTQAFSSYFAHRLKGHSNRFFYLIFLINGMILLLASYLYSVPALVLLIVFSLLFTIIHVVFDGRLQDSIPSATRATVTSVNEFFVEVGVLAIYFSVGAIAQISGYRNSFLLYGMIISILGLLYVVFGPRAKASRN